MKSIELPSPEESQLEIKVDGKSYIMDLMDLADLWAECLQEKKETGSENPDIIIDIFIHRMKDKHEIPLSKSTATTLLNYVFEEEQELKKKLYALLGASDSTDSQDPPTNEASDSSNESFQTSKPKNSLSENEPSHL